MRIIFYDHGCKSFLTKYNSQKKINKNLIEKAQVKEDSNGMTKIKLDSIKRINGEQIYEFRLNLGTIGSVRIAFSVFKYNAIIYYISKDMEKASFRKAFEKVLR